MKHRIVSRISAVALAGLLAVVPVAGAVAVAPPAAAATSHAVVEPVHMAAEDGDGAEKIAPISEDGETPPAPRELDDGFPWIFAASVGGGLAVAVAAMIIMHRNDKAARTRTATNR
jgi:hypothetical protein